jgi:hypothetical protein
MTPAAGERREGWTMGERWELVTWTADGVQAMAMRFHSEAFARMAGATYLRMGCAAYRVCRVPAGWSSV